MKRTLFLGLFAVFLLFSGKTLSSEPVNPEELSVLKAAAGLHAVFEQFAGDIWPGYDLSRQPFLLYLPDHWALLLNTSTPLKGFREYPASWPDLGFPAFFFPGKYDNLVGQFEFNFKIDSVTSFAMGAPHELLDSMEKPAVYFFTTTVHEGFHQYQFNHFGEIPWAREEQYPILDVENAALAALEMHLLRDALRSAAQGDLFGRDSALQQFVAVRSFRWQQADPFVKKYEQGQEINEGTARYVEMKSVVLFLRLDTTRVGNRLVRALYRDFAGVSMPDYLLQDMTKRLTGQAVSPENMARNRIYPVGATLGFLLDELGIEWKKQFQAAGESVSFPQLLKNHFRLTEGRLAALRRQAKRKYDFPEILSRAQELVTHYRREFQRQKEQFDRQKGFRVEIELSSNGLRRFRSTKAKTFLLEKGRQMFCPRYILYTLERKNTCLELRDRAVYEENDWGKRLKKVVFYLPALSRLKVNGDPISLSNQLQVDFASLEMETSRFQFHSEQAGRIELVGHTVRIVLK